MLTPILLLPLWLKPVLEPKLPKPLTWADVQPAIELIDSIEELRDAGSEKARIQILKDNNRGENPKDVRKRLRNIPWKHRLVRYCPPCKEMFVVDGRKEKSEQRCHSCGSNEIYKDEEEYLKTPNK